jgi:hypothetical protein
VKPVPHYVLALAMAIPALLVGAEIPSWLSLGSQRYALQSDLRVVYTPGYMLRTGQAKDIYNFAAVRRNQNEKIAPDNGALPFLHPAYEAVLFMPLSLLPYRAACVVWAGVNFVILALVYFLLRPCFPDLSAVGPKWIPPALLLGFMPVAFTIMEGQDSLLLLPILVFAYRRIGSNERQAGILLGLGMFRFQVLLPIVALFLLWRSLKFVAAWVAGSAAVLSISAAITGVNTSGCCVRWAASPPCGCYCAASPICDVPLMPRGPLQTETRWHELHPEESTTKELTKPPPSRSGARRPRGRGMRGRW